jgi:Tat-targeted selenate reductase subunit YnfE
MTATRDGVRGKEKLDVPIKFIWNYAGNTIINQHSDINKTHDILQDESKCEMIVVIDNFMTSSAKYADILLPDLMTVEQEDIIPNDYAGNMGYLIFIQPVTSAKFERKPIYWILSEVANASATISIRSLPKAAPRSSGCSICTPKCWRKTRRCRATTN